MGRANLAFAMLLALPAVAQPKADITAAAAWDGLLKRHVSAGRVDYAGMSRDRASLESYLAWVAEPRDADLAFYLNAYNANVVASVIRHGRPARVTDVPGFFDKTKHRVAGRETTLNDLETSMRKRFADPRIHFALNCAANSCPPLPSRAFEAKSLNATLDDLTRRFLNGDGVRIDAQRRTAAVSRLFEWYRDDFVAKEGSIDKYLLRWVDDSGRRAALLAGATVTFQDYDWTLNAR